jgi:hypothetical protein
MGSQGIVLPSVSMGRTTFPGRGVGGGVAVSVGGKGVGVNVAVEGIGEEVTVDVGGIAVAAAGAGEQLTSRMSVSINERPRFMMSPLEDISSLKHVV